MAASQRKFREIIFQIIFSQDFGGGIDVTSLSFMRDQFMMTKARLRQACAKVDLVISNKKVIDRLLSKFSKSYSLSRISRIEYNILQLSIFELLFDEEIPPKVAISEAIRLSRKFGAPEGGAFVNAILDIIYVAQREGNVY